MGHVCVTFLFVLKSFLVPLLIFVLALLCCMYYFVTDMFTANKTTTTTYVGFLFLLLWSLYSSTLQTAATEAIMVTRSI